MKQKVFISYSAKDIDKVDIVEKAFSNHPSLEAIIVERSKEPMKLLVDKVKDGINACIIVVPILTAKSMNTQWINQEIGYAFAKDIPVRPLIASNILDTLKGFVHKQMELSHLFNVNDEMRIENENFSQILTELIEDIDKEKNSIIQTNSILDEESHIETIERAIEAERNKIGKFESGIPGLEKYKGLEYILVTSTHIGTHGNPTSRNVFLQNILPVLRSYKRIFQKIQETNLSQEKKNELRIHLKEELEFFRKPLREHAYNGLKEVRPFETRFNEYFELVEWLFPTMLIV